MKKGLGPDLNFGVLHNWSFKEKRHYYSAPFYYTFVHKNVIVMTFKLLSSTINHVSIYVASMVL